jgi:hypothetical protein
MKKGFSIIRLLTMVVMVLALTITLCTPVLADTGIIGSTAGANSNDLALSLSVVPNLVCNGATVNYYMTISNPINQTPGLITADAVNVVVSFFPPGPDGLPIATPTYVSAPFNIAAGGTPVNLPVQPVVLNLNPGVMAATAKATFTGTLLTYPIDSQVSGEKNIPLTLITIDCSITANGPVCAGSTNQASVAFANAESYTWTISGGTITDGQGTQTITYVAGNGPTVNLGVTVVLSNCSSTCTATVAVNSLPEAKITSNPANGTICPTGEITSAVLSAPEAPAGETYSYLWSTGETTREITVSPTVNTTYTVTVTNAATGCSSTASFPVKIHCEVVVGGSVMYDNPVSTFLPWIILLSLVLIAGFGITLKLSRKNVK